MSDPIVAIAPNDYLDARHVDPVKCTVMEKKGVVRFAKQTGVVYVRQSFAELLGIGSKTTPRRDDETSVIQSAL